MYGPSGSTASTRPFRVGYWLMAALLVVAVVGAILAVVGFSAFGRQIDSFQRVQVPGDATVTFSKAGSYLIYFEGPGFSGLSSTGTVRVSIQSQNSGQQVSISALHGKQETYSLGGHSGQAVASFTIVTPGKYVVNAGIPTEPAPTDIAVGPGIGSSLAEAIVGLVFAILGLIGAVAIGIVTRVLRCRAARRLLYASQQVMQPGMAGTPYPAPGTQRHYTQYPGPRSPGPPRRSSRTASTRVLPRAAGRTRGPRRTTRSIQGPRRTTRSIQGPRRTTRSIQGLRRTTRRIRPARE
jgi:hypothetical protein